jgi:hypothetical protein
MNLAFEETVPLFQNVKKEIFVQSVFHTYSFVQQIVSKNTFYCALTYKYNLLSVRCPFSLIIPGLPYINSKGCQSAISAIFAIYMLVISLPAEQQWTHAHPFLP